MSCAPHASFPRKRQFSNPRTSFTNRVHRLLDCPVRPGHDNTVDARHKAGHDRIGEAKVGSMTNFTVVPALDLKGGMVVHAVGGDRTAYSPIASPFGAADDPAPIARGLLTTTGSPAPAARAP